jgi:hypothetical protein
MLERKAKHTFLSIHFLRKLWGVEIENMEEYGRARQATGGGIIRRIKDAHCILGN